MLARAGGKQAAGKGRLGRRGTGRQAGPGAVGGSGREAGWAAGAREETAAATAGPRERIGLPWAGLGKKGRGVMGRTGLGWVSWVWV